MVKPDLELRHLAPSHVEKLGSILNLDWCGEREWKRLMTHIPKEHRDDGSLRDVKKFKQDDIDKIHDASISSGKTAFEILVSEWGTMGRIRPTVLRLLMYCIELKSFRAASYISEIILEMEPVSESNSQSVLDKLLPKQPSTVNIANEPSSPTVFAQDDDNWLEYELGQLAINPAEEQNSDFIHSPVPPENALPVHHVKYDYLRSITKDFSALDSSRCIGRGGFATVHLGITNRSNVQLAVKKLHPNPDDRDNRMTFDYEVFEATKLEHKHIIKVLAYSNDRPDSICLVYPFMENGTLEERLRDSRDPSKSPLSAKLRLNICIGIADALVFLHTRQKALIHRDVKTSNILLDKDWTSKLADFGLLRHAATNNTETVHAKGTPRYMAPEAHRGGLLPVSDVFSFGVVLLEVVTGLPSYDTSMEGRDLLTHVQNKVAVTVGSPISEDERIRSLIDKRAGWNGDDGERIFHFAYGRCLKDNAAERVDSKETLQALQAFVAE